MRILVVEDDARLLALLTRALSTEGYAVSGARDGDKAYDLAVANVPDLIVLDLGLPGLDGRELAESLRRDGVDTPILMLTARDGLSDRIEGFRAGADDYVVKPFALEELLARIKALLRRSFHVAEERRLTVGELTLDLKSREVQRQGLHWSLTPKEFELLEYLMLHPGQVLSKEQIIDRIWDGVETGANVVEVTVRRIRRKIEEGGGEMLLQTVKGVGYKIRDSRPR